MRTRKTSADRRSNLVVVRRENEKSDAVIAQKKRKKGGIAQLARASALQAEGRRFDSDYLHHKDRHCQMPVFFCILAE